MSVSRGGGLRRAGGVVVPLALVGAIFALSQGAASAREGLTVVGDVGVWLLQLAEPAAVSAISQACVVERDHRPDLRRFPRDLRSQTRARGADPWSRDRRVPPDRRDPDAPCRAARCVRPTAGETVIHSDQGTQFTSWAFTRRAIDSGLVPSMGSIGDCFDNAMIESFWSRMQVELLDRQRWETRIELANAIFEYLEIWHNRQRRHTSLRMLTPVAFEARHQQSPAA